MVAAVADKRFAKVGLTPDEEQRIRRKMMRGGLSRAWVEAQFVTIRLPGTDGAPVAVRAQVKPTSHPPSPLAQCACCRQFYPAYYLEHERCRYAVVVVRLRGRLVRRRGRLIRSEGPVCIECMDARRQKVAREYGPSPLRRAMERIRVLQLKTI